jgi:plasmid stability protein
MALLSTASTNAASTPSRENAMASLSVRQLDEETIARLRARAANHGVSMEEEARRILREVVAAPERLGDLALELFGPGHGADPDLPGHAPHNPVNLAH